MAEDMEIVEKLNGDNLQVNGDENGERSDDVNSSKDTDSGVLTDGYKMENQEPLDTSDSSIRLGLEDSPGKEKRVDDSKGTPAATDSKESVKDAADAKEGSKSPRGVKRKASSTLSDVDDMEESLKGFEAPVDDGSADRYIRLVDKYQSELRETEAQITSSRPSRARKLPVKRARTGTPTDNYSSRPSSGLSLRSENELVGGNSSSTEVTSSAASSPAARRAVRAETSHAAYRVPLDRGWKRELVYRATLEHGSGARRNADVYYYTPSAKKLRSNREVAEHIAGTGLTLDNFTFFKEPLGVDDPEKEIIRDAKIVRRVESPSPHVSTPVVAATTPGREGKRTPKPKTPKGASPERAGAASPRTGGGKLKVKSVGSRLSSGPPSVATPPKPVKTPRKSLPAVATNNNTTTGWKKPRAAEGARRVGAAIGAGVPPPPPLLYGPAQQGAVTGGKLLSPPRGGGQQPCSVRCAGAEGRVPSLQCASCLCLYHERCCAPSGVVRQAFVCKNCQPQQGPPPLTHMSAMKPTQSKFLGISGNHQPPSMRIPKPVPTLVRPPDPKRPIPVPRLTPIRRVIVNPTPKLIKKPVQGPNAQVAMQEQKRVVMKMKMQSASSGSGQAVWTVQSSDAHASSQLGMNANNMQMITIDPMKLPQTIAYVNGRKFIVVPKNSFVNAVASGVAAAATSRAAKTEEGDDVIGDTKERDEVKTKDNEDVKKSVLGCVGGASEPLKDGDTETSASVVKTEESTDRDTESSMDISQTDVEDSPSLKRRGPGRAPLANGSPGARRRGRTGRSDEQPGGVDHFAQFYKRSHERGFNSVVQIFQYLKMRELAAAARVCRLWRDLAATPALWRHVRMKNSQVSDWRGLCAALKVHGTRRLDLRKMLLPASDAHFWLQFSEHIANVDTLERIDLCRCPAAAVERLCVSHPRLLALGALAVRCDRLDPAPLAALTKLEELRIKSMAGLTLTSDLKPLANLTNLKHLSLTSIKELGSAACGVVGSLRALESLELGECTFGPDFGDAVLARLSRLQRLRLERGTAECGAPRLLRALAGLPALRHLELVNFDVKTGFDDALAECTNIKRLLIIPTYVSQSATTNRQVLSGVLRLKDTLTHLMWGVTIELLRVTELFIDQCDQGGEKKKANIGECIPVLKPVPGLSAVKLDEGKDSAVEKPVNGPPQVEILPLPSLQRLLNTSLPHTKLKVLRIPFHATWRQSLADFQ